MFDYYNRYEDAPMELENSVLVTFWENLEDRIELFSIQFQRVAEFNEYSVYAPEIN